jgi:hypothetical protein
LQKKQYISTGVFLAFIFLVSYQAQAQQVLLNFFNLNPNGADILLEWEVQDETDIAEYRLFRKFQEDPTFTFVGSLTPNGSKRYQYLDDDIFKSTSRVLVYELQVVKDNQVYRFTVNLSHNPSSIQRTWGSIKSMFK